MTEATETAAPGITDQELAALILGGWDDHPSRPQWERRVKVGKHEMLQHVGPMPTYGKWRAESPLKGMIARHFGHRGGVRADTLDEVLAWCDEQTRGRKPDKPGTATKQEHHFASIAASDWRF